MEDDVTNVVILSRFLVAAGVVATVVVLLGLFVSVQDEERPRTSFWLRHLRWSLPLGILSPFIAPWVALVLYSAWRINWNSVHYLQRPPIVDPAPQEHIKVHDTQPEKPQ